MWMGLAMWIIRAPSSMCLSGSEYSCHQDGHIRASGLSTMHWECGVHACFGLVPQQFGSTPTVNEFACHKQKCVHQSNACS